VDYSHDEQEQEVAGLAATVFDDIVTPEHLAALEQAGAAYDERTWRELAKTGLLGIAVPEEHGGSGATLVELGLVVEHAARVNAPVFLVESAAAAAAAITHYGTVAQRTCLLPAFAAGESVLTSALARRSPSSPGFTATASGADLVVTGAMAHVPLAPAADRILLPVVDAEGQRGLVLLAPQADSVTLAEHPSVDRQRRWRVEADGVRVSAADVLVAPGADSEAALAWHDVLVTTFRSVQQLGTAQAALAMTAEHARTRTQFGRAIGTFQAVSHAVADAYIDVQGIRLTAWRALWLLARGVVDPEAAAIAGWWAADAPVRILETAMQVHGGMSVDLDYPLHRYFLAARQGGLALGGPGQALLDLGDRMAVA
jgi:alkylation response protein AidB-like acyl-CoA dehydrogenase